MLGCGSLTDEPEHALGERQHAGVEQQAEAVGAVLQGQHVQHGQEEAGLRDGAQARPRRVLVGDGLQGNRLHACRNRNHNQNRAGSLKTEPPAPLSVLLLYGSSICVIHCTCAINISDESVIHTSGSLSGFRNTFSKSQALILLRLMNESVLYGAAYIKTCNSGEARTHLPSSLNLTLASSSMLRML